MRARKEPKPKTIKVSEEAHRKLNEELLLLIAERQSKDLSLSDAIVHLCDLADRYREGVCDGP